MELSDQASFGISVSWVTQISSCNLPDIAILQLLNSCNS
jgi:hypothetical protein